MSKTVAEMKKEQIAKYNTADNTHEDFPVGTRVKIVTPCCDFTFFYGEEGIVTDNNGGYLGITVRYNEPRHYEDGRVETGFSFNPPDLFKIPDPEIPRHDLLDFD